MRPEPCPIAPVADDPEYDTRVYVGAVMTFPNPCGPRTCADGIERDTYHISGVGLCWFNRETEKWHYVRNPILRPGYALAEEYRRRRGWSC